MFCSQEDLSLREDFDEFKRMYENFNSNPTILKFAYMILYIMPIEFWEDKKDIEKYIRSFTVKS
jgi:hypothetical protein